MIDMTYKLGVRLNYSENCPCGNEDSAVTIPLYIHPAPLKIYEPLQAPADWDPEEMDVFQVPVGPGQKEPDSIETAQDVLENQM